MNTSLRLTDKEYEELSIKYEKNPLELSGNPGLLTKMREQLLVTELLSPNYARIAIMKQNPCRYRPRMLSSMH